MPKDTADLIRICAHASLHRLRTDWHDVLLCHEGDIEDPTIYLEGFEALVEEGRLRYYGISTNSIEVLKKFNRHGTCTVVQVDYSLLNRQPEEEFLPYCEQEGIAVMARGPLAKGLLSGRYDLDSVFADDVRAGFNRGEAGRAGYEAQVAQVARLAQNVAPGGEMVAKALGYALSHSTASGYSRCQVACSSQRQRGGRSVRIVGGRVREAAHLKQGGRRQLGECDIE